jgi:peptide/nickel transport system substrate-binding protein
MAATLIKFRTMIAVSALLAATCMAVAGPASGKIKTTKPVLTLSACGANAGLGPGDPAKNTATAVGMSLEYEAPLHWNPNGTVSAELATSWKYISDPAGDRKAFKFTLRHDAKFSDGTPVTAAAVKAWYTYVLNDNAPNLFTFGGLRSIQTIGKWTVVIHVKSPNPELPFVLSDASAVSLFGSPKAVADPTIFQTRDAGAGPYMLDPSQSVTGSYYTLIPNPYYYDKSRQVWSKVVGKAIPTGTTALAAVQTGQLDYACGDVGTVDAARAAGIKVLTNSLGGQFGYAFGLDFTRKDIGPLANAAVRQALNYAVDRKTITAAVFGSNATPTSEWTSIDSIDPKYTNYYAYNPTKAKALLASAGYAQGFNMTVLSLQYPTFDPMTEAICQYFKAVNVTCKITTDTFATWGADYTGGKFDAVTFGSGGSGGAIGMWGWYNTYLKPNGILNPSPWHDSVLDKLWVRGSRSNSPSTYWLQMTHRVTQQADFLAISAPKAFFYVSKKVSGVVLSPFSQIQGGSEARDWRPAK